MEKIKYENLKRYLQLNEGKEPILKGCKNKTCFCTGDCKQIIGWKTKDLTPEYFS